MHAWQSIRSCCTIGRHSAHIWPHVARQQSRCGSRWLIPVDGNVAVAPAPVCGAEAVAAAVTNENEAAAELKDDEKRPLVATWFGPLEDVVVDEDGRPPE